MAALPTYAIASLGGVRRVGDAVLRSTPPPRASVHETPASSRERRLRLAGIVLTGIIALLIFERFTDGGGDGRAHRRPAVALGIADWREAGVWDAAEREREPLLRPHPRRRATPRLGIREVYEAPRPGRADDHVYEPSPFDLEI